MGLGTGIALLVVGGILAFGVKDSFSALDLTDEVGRASRIG